MTTCLADVRPLRKDKGRIREVQGLGNPESLAKMALRHAEVTVCNTR